METNKSKKKQTRVGLIFFLAWLLMASFVIMTSAATNGSGNTTNSEFTWSWTTNNTNSGATGEVNGTLSGTSLSIDISASSSTYLDEKKDSCGDITQEQQNAISTTTTATVTNNTGATIRILTVSTTNTADCTASVGSVLVSGDKFQITITAAPVGSSSTTSNTVSGNVTVTYEVVENVDVTYYGADGASYVVDGNTLDSASASKISEILAGNSIALPAAPSVSSGTFAGWRLGHDGSLRAAGETVTINNNTSVYPVIIEESLVAPFTVNDVSYYYWTDAAYNAGTSGTIVLNQDYTLPTTMAANGVSPAGSAYLTGTDGNLNYIVPSGVTLLIPYDDANTLCTTEPVFYGSEGTFLDASANSWVKPTAYRTLKMASGTNLIVNGALSISGKVCGAIGSNGCPTGPLGFVAMESDSNITINSGAFLYAWGYITGSGSVTVKNGGTVYENFQLRDWRGGDAASGMIDKDQKVFPVSQYYVQNVEVPMTFEAGALEYGYMCLVAAKTFGETTVPFIGGSGMFQNSGSVTKDYLEEEDRLSAVVEGNLTMSNLNLQISSYKMNSSKYVLPLTNNMSIKIKNGETVIGQDMCLLPGAEITVDKGATVSLASGVSFFIYDTAEWVDKGYVYSNCDMKALAYVGANKGAPNARAALADAKIVVNGTVDASSGYVYTTSGGANITSDGGGKVIMGTPGTATVTYQATQSGTTITFASIDISAALLKNANPADEYTKTATGGAGTYYYCLRCGMWYKESDTAHSCDPGWLTNVALANNLHMYFAFPTGDLESSNYKVVLTHYHADGTVTVKEYDGQSLTGVTMNQKDYYRLIYTGVAAKQMTDSVTVQVYDAGGNLKYYYGDTIRDYAHRLYNLTSTSDNLKKVIVDMLNYGAACQDFFDYKKSDLANAKLTDAQKALASTNTYTNTTNPDSAGNTIWFKSQLIVDSNIRFRVAFDSKVTTVTYTFTNHKDNSNPVTKTVTITDNDIINIDGVNYYCMLIDGLVVADAADPNFQITVETDSGSFTETMKNYAARMSGDHQVYTMFMRFSETAYTYLHNKTATQEG